MSKNVTDENHSKNWISNVDETSLFFNYAKCQIKANKLFEEIFVWSNTKNGQIVLDVTSLRGGEGRGGKCRLPIALNVNCSSGKAREDDGRHIKLHANPTPTPTPIQRDKTLLFFTKGGMRPHNIIGIELNPLTSNFRS